MTTRRRAGVLIAGMLGLVGIGATVAAAPVAIAQADVTPGRVAGVNRFDTAAKIAAAAYPGGAASVLLANGRTFPDALAGSALGGAKNAPLLLTETATTPTETMTALQSLKPTTIYLLGGTNAISQAQQDELAKTYTVTRVAGADRYATAGAIADQIGLVNVANLNGKRTAFIATGLNFADALAGGPLAAAGAGAAGVHPVLLVNSDVPAATDSALTRLAIQQVVVLGGTTAVSEAVADKLAAKTGNPVIRYAGTNRYDTAAKVAQAGLNSYGLIASEVLLASGADFADALAAGPFGFKRTAPLILTEPASLPPQSAAFLEDNSSAIQKVTAVGGTAAVSANALTQAEKAAETPSNDRQNEGIQVSPQSADSLANSGTRSFVANGITSATVDIVLVPCANVSNDNGSTKFVN
ncbi:MAG: cell wall-binding repeat-containing protein, partial [Acidobacteria bacterium]|nr:cell wall-binding repeat-containing protein [Acidobacteriota bacterium]